MLNSEIHHKNNDTQLKYQLPIYKFRDEAWSQNFDFGISGEHSNSRKQATNIDHSPGNFSRQSRRKLSFSVKIQETSDWYTA